MDVTSFSERLNQARNKKGLTLKALAAAANVSPSAMTHYGRGASLPPLDIAARLASALGVSLDWLCGMGNDPATENTLKFHSAYNTYGDVAFTLFQLLYVKGLDSAITTGATATGSRVSFSLYNCELLYDFFHKWDRLSQLEGDDIQTITTEWLTGRMKELWATDLPEDEEE